MTGRPGPPPHAPRSPDGKRYWNGQLWLPVPPGNGRLWAFLNRPAGAACSAGLLAFVIGLGLGSSREDAGQQQALRQQALQLQQTTADLASARLTATSAQARLDRVFGEGDLTSTTGDGAYEVGRDLRPGTYRTGGGADCSFTVGAPDGSTVVRVTHSPRSVRLRPGTTLQTHGCGTWTLSPSEN